jgi:syntenin-1
MSLYPSVEDKTVGDMAQAQQQNVSFMGENVVAAVAATPPAYGGYNGYTPYKPQQQVVASGASSGALAVTQDGGLRNYKKAQIHEGVRAITVIPDAHGKLGLKVKSVSKGIFVQAVIKGLPAAAAGLRFGDQILSCNDTFVAGFSSDKAHNLLVKAVKSGRIDLSVRERPFERTIVLKKSSDNHLGFEFKNGRIMTIRKDSSAARNGLLIDHNFVEVNGQNVVHMKDKDILKIIVEGGESVTLTIVPEPMFKIMCKNLGDTPLKLMDHSIPEL